MQEVCTFEQLIMIKIVIENVCGKGDVPDDMKCCFLLEPFKKLLLDCRPLVYCLAQLPWKLNQLLQKTIVTLEKLSYAIIEYLNKCSNLVPSEAFENTRKERQRCQKADLYRK